MWCIHFAEGFSRNRNCMCLCKDDDDDDDMNAASELNSMMRFWIHGVMCSDSYKVHLRCRTVQHVETGNRHFAPVAYLCLESTRCRSYGRKDLTPFEAIAVCWPSRNERLELFRARGTTASRIKCRRCSIIALTYRFDSFWTTISRCNALMGMLEVGTIS